jgi:hypothetical protein
MIFVCGCYESDLWLCVIKRVFIPAILLKNFSKTEANGTKWG